MPVPRVNSSTRHKYTNGGHNTTCSRFVATSCAKSFFIALTSSVADARFVFIFQLPAIMGVRMVRKEIKDGRLETRHTEHPSLISNLQPLVSFFLRLYHTRSLRARDDNFIYPRFRSPYLPCASENLAHCRARARQIIHVEFFR